MVFVAFLRFFLFFRVFFFFFFFKVIIGVFVFWFWFLKGGFLELCECFKGCFLLLLFGV